MNVHTIINQLEQNAVSFRAMLSGVPGEMQVWKPAPEKWSLLEILCHLYDEEQYDFKARIRHILENPEAQMQSINPTAWVAERKYMEQDFYNTLQVFEQERKQSVNWLHTIENTDWEQFYQHPKLGKMTAAILLANWLAHDYLHFRQIIATKYQYLKQHINENLDYAGNW